MDLYIFFSATAATIYFTVCLLGGLMLCTNLLPAKSFSNVILSRLVGAIFLLLSFSTILCLIAYVDILFYSAGSVPVLYSIGGIIDGIAITMQACAGYLLYSNNQPKKSVLVLLSAPFLLLTLTVPLFQTPSLLLQRIGDALIIALFVFFSYKFHRREKTLEQIYSDPVSHSLNWINIILSLFVGWVILREILFWSGSVLYDIILYIYLTCSNIIATVLVLRHPAPVSIKTQEEVEKVEQVDSMKNFNDSSEPSQHQKELLRLLSAQRLFLDHDLTIEAVARSMGTSVPTLSAIIHYEMKTTFTQIVNSYRIEYAKELLQNTDSKLDFIAASCGFNSYQVFARTFNRFTGKKPSEWRVE